MDKKQTRKQIRALKQELEQQLQELGLDQFDARYLSIYGPDAITDTSKPVAEKIKRAVKDNWAKRDRLMDQIEQQKETQAADLLARFNRGERLTNKELDRMVESGLARRVYDNPDSNRPTGIVLR